MKIINIKNSMILRIFLFFTITSQSCSNPNTDAVPLNNSNNNNTPKSNNAIYYAYSANTTDSSFTFCKVSGNTGLLSECNRMAADGGYSPSAIAFNNGYAYVTNDVNQNAAFYSLNRNTGVLSGLSIAATGINNPRSIAISNNYAYIGSENGNLVYLCKINSSTGAFSGACSTTATGSNFNIPSFIAISNNFAYISNFGSNKVFRCNVSTSTGDLSGCISTGTGFEFSKPTSISINNNYAYIINHSNMGSTPTNGNVTLCKVNNVGDLFDCANTGPIVTLPFTIFIKNNYAYIMYNHSDTILVCNVNSSTGDLSGCIDNGTGFSNAIRFTITDF